METTEALELAGTLWLESILTGILLGAVGAGPGWSAMLCEGTVLWACGAYGRRQSRASFSLQLISSPRFATLLVVATVVGTASPQSYTQ